MLTLEDGIRLREQMFADEGLLSRYDLADKMSGSQTKHGRQHAFDVVTVGCQFMDQLNRLFLGMFSPWEREVLGPIALFGHDIGRAVDPAKHDRLGAAIIGKYLKEHTPLELPDRRRICWAIRNHRADRCLALDFDDKLWAVLVIADKCVGDAARVRGTAAMKLQLIKLLGLARRTFANGNEDHRNNVVNYAIKAARLDVDRNDSPEPRYRGAIVLNLDLDEALVTPEQVLTGVDWFRESWHACARACQYLGFVFRIEFNGARWFWSKEARGWRTLDSIDVPRA